MATDPKKAEPKKAPDPRKLIQKAIKDLNLPEGAVCGFGDVVEVDAERIETPFPSLNLATSGLPRGRIICMSGAPGTAKTTLALHCMAKALEDHPDWIALWVDAENTFDKKWATKLGVDLTRVVIIQGLLNLEAYLDAFNRIVATGGIQFAVIDSVGCSAPLGEIQSKGGEARCLTDDTVALQARVYSKWSRLAVPSVATNKVVAILIAQIYTDINSYGGLPQTKGGNALKHATSLRLMTRRAKEKQTVKVRMPDGTPKEIEVGWEMHIRIDKTKLNEKEGYEIVLPFRRGAGIVAAEAAIQAAMRFGLVSQKGSFYEYRDSKWRGRKAVVDHFMGNPAALDELTGRLVALVEGQAAAEEQTSQAEPEAPADAEVVEIL